MKSGQPDCRGFTLLEVIMVITVAGVLAAVMVPYLGTAVTDSGRAVNRLGQSASLTQTAERITAYFQANPADLNGLSDDLAGQPENFGDDFTVITNEFIKFINENDTPISEGEDENILKIKIRQDQTLETLTLVFTRQ